MIIYFAKHNRKYFNRNKPTSFDCELCCINTPEEYFLNFDVGQYTNFKTYYADFRKVAASFTKILDETF